MKGLIEEFSRTQEDIYQGMKEARATVIHCLERTIQEMVPRLICCPDRVLEIGAGDGFLKRTLKPDCEWIEFDRDGGKKRRRSNGFVKGDATKLPFDNKSFDAVLGYESFNAFNYEDLEKAVRESLRVLKPGGSFLVFHDFEIASEVTMGILGRRYLSRQRITPGHKLTHSVLKVVPPEKRKAYNKTYKRLSERNKNNKDNPLANARMLFEPPKELEKFWEEITMEKALKLFHNYITKLIKGKFEDVQTGAEVGDGIFARNIGQIKCPLSNFLGTYFSEKDMLSKLMKKCTWSQKIGYVFAYLGRETVSIPYTVGKGRK